MTVLIHPRILWRRIECFKHVLFCMLNYMYSFNVMKCIYITRQDSNYFRKIRLRQFQWNCASPIEICEHDTAILRNQNMYYMGHTIGYRNRPFTVDFSNIVVIVLYCIICSTHVGYLDWEEDMAQKCLLLTLKVEYTEYPVPVTIWNQFMGMIIRLLIQVVCKKPWRTYDIKSVCVLFEHNTCNT